MCGSIERLYTFRGAWNYTGHKFVRHARHAGTMMQRTGPPDKSPPPCVAGARAALDEAGIKSLGIRVPTGTIRGATGGNMK